MSLYCPKCEKPLDHHDESGQCPKRLSRRFFLGMLGSALAATTLAKYLPDVAVEAAKAKRYLNSNDISYAALEVLRNNLTYRDRYQNYKIGDTIMIRKPVFFIPYSNPSFTEEFDLKVYLG